MEILLGVASSVAASLSVSIAICTINTITTTSRNIYSIIDSISNSNVPEKDEAIKLIKKLDLEMTIKIINSLIDEMPENNMKSKTVILCLESLNDVIKQIEDELNKINKLFEYNDNIMIFKRLRSYNCTENFNTLIELKGVLDNRKNLLFKTLQIEFIDSKETVLV